MATGEAHTAAVDGFGRPARRSWHRWYRPLMVLFASLALALQVLFQPDVLAHYGASQTALAIMLALRDNLIVCLMMAGAVVLVQRGGPTEPWLRSIALIAAVWVTSAIGNLALGVWSFGTDSRVWLPFVFGETLRWAVLGSFLALVDSFRSRRLAALTEADSLRITRELLLTQTELAQWQLLEAQIEPHFLFNTIANLRRTWRIDPALGERMHDNLLHYLRAALPRMRTPVAMLGEECELLRAYLELFALRMGPRLAFSIDVPEPLRQVVFPRMMLLTLAENAIKHGLMPSATGGRIEISARGHPATLVVSVDDDGVGFGAADTGGTGVGLVNIRSRLATQYGGAARLVIAARDTGGVRATIELPWPAAAMAITAPWVTPAHAAAAPAAEDVSDELRLA